MGPRIPAANSLWNRLWKGWARSRRCCEPTLERCGCCSGGQSVTARCAFPKSTGLLTLLMQNRPSTCAARPCCNERSARIAVKDCSQRDGDEPVNEVQEILVEQSCSNVGSVRKTSSTTQGVIPLSSEAELYAAPRAAACASNDSKSFTKIGCRQSPRAHRNKPHGVNPNRHRSSHGTQKFSPRRRIAMTAATPSAADRLVNSSFVENLMREVTRVGTLLQCVFLGRPVKLLRRTRWSLRVSRDSHIARQQV